MTARPTPDPAADARTRLLDRLVAHGAEHGLAHLSLRELAAAVGTSHRMILYHFGSREGLVAAAVARVEAGQRELMLRAAESAADGPDLVRAVWAAVADPARRDAVALFFEVLAAAAQGRPGTEGFLEGLSTPWLGSAADAAGHLGIDVDDVELTLGLAVVRGLLVELLVSGDRDAATAALERHLDRWQATQALPGR